MGYVTVFMQFAIVSILPCIDYINITLGSNNFTIFYFQIAFKNQHCKCSNAHLMFRIFIKIRNLALTLWFF